MSDDSYQVEYVINSMFSLFAKEGELIPSIDIKKMDWEYAFLLRDLQGRVKTYIAKQYKK